MIKIKYNNKNTFEEVTFYRNGNLVTMTPTTPNTSGFTTWKLDGEIQLGDFSTILNKPSKEGLYYMRINLEANLTGRLL